MKASILIGLIVGILIVAWILIAAFGRLRFERKVEARAEADMASAFDPPAGQTGYTAVTAEQGTGTAGQKAFAFDLPEVKPDLEIVTAKSESVSMAQVEKTDVSA